MRGYFGNRLSSLDFSQSENDEPRVVLMMR